MVALVWRFRIKNTQRSQILVSVFLQSYLILIKVIWFSGRNSWHSELNLHNCSKSLLKSNLFSLLLRSNNELAEAICFSSRNSWRFRIKATLGTKILQQLHLIFLHFFQYNEVSVEAICFFDQSSWRFRIKPSQLIQKLALDCLCFCNLMLLQKIVHSVLSHIIKMWNRIFLYYI